MTHRRTSPAAILWWSEVKLCLSCKVCILKLFLNCTENSRLYSLLFLTNVNFLTTRVTLVLTDVNAAYFSDVTLFYLMGEGNCLATICSKGRWTRQRDFLSCWCLKGVFYFCTKHSILSASRGKETSCCAWKWRPCSNVILGSNFKKKINLQVVRLECIVICHRDSEWY